MTKQMPDEKVLENLPEWAQPIWAAQCERRPGGRLPRWYNARTIRFCRALAEALGEVERLEGLQDAAHTKREDLLDACRTEVRMREDAAAEVERLKGELARYREREEYRQASEIKPCLHCHEKPVGFMGALYCSERCTAEALLKEGEDAAGA